MVAVQRAAVSRGGEGLRMKAGGVSGSMAAVVAVSLAAMLTLAGCGGTVIAPPVVEKSIQGTAGTSATVTPSIDSEVPAITSGLGGVDAPPVDNTDELYGDPSAADTAALLAQRVIYFNYDSSIITAQGETVLQAHAAHLDEAREVHLILEGHADERGTREYNLALGEDRARSVANVLQALGVGVARISTVSYGEERPLPNALGHDNSAWRKNRRVEILYQ